MKPDWLIGICAGLMFAVPAGPLAFSSGERNVELVGAAPAAVTDARLLLGFADRSGIFLANVHVMIENQKGQRVADLVVDGPWLELGLNPGTYNISAVFEGVSQRLRGLRLNDRSVTTRVLYWDLDLVPNEMLAQLAAKTST